MTAKQKMNGAREKYLSNPKNVEIVEFWNQYIIDCDLKIKAQEEADYKIKLENDKKFRKLEETKAKSWNDFEIEFDSFHLDLMQYKTAKTDENFEKIWPRLKSLNRQMAAKYIIKMPMKMRQIFLIDANSDDYFEFLTEKMLTAIDAWNPEKYVKFTTFYDKIILNYVGGFKTQSKGDWYQDTELVSINTEGVEKLMDEIAKKHYKYDENGKMFMDTYIYLFCLHINKIDNRLGLIFCALKNNETHSEIAKYMSVTTKTVQRKIEIIKEEWLKYNAEV